jgi:hypothetical protein
MGWCRVCLKQWPNMLNSLYNLLQGKPADPIVWTADITYWIAGQKEAGTARTEWDSVDGYLQLHHDLGIMPYYYYDKFWIANSCYAENVHVSQDRDGGQITNWIKTPRGSLVETLVYLPSSCSTGCTRHYVETEDDLDVFLNILEQRHLEPANLDDYPARAQYWASHDGLPSLGLPRSPLSSFIYEWAGVEHAAFLLADCKDKVKTVLRLMEEQEEPVIEALCRVCPPLVHFPDNLSSDTLTGYYAPYMAAAHARRLDRLHSVGIKAAVHLDGAVRGLLPRLADVGFDAVEALTPAPAGDVTPAEMLKLAGNTGVILWGGVPGIMFAPPFTWEDMQAHVRGVLDCWKAQPFILGVADQVPPDGNIDFCRQIAEML